MRVPSNNPTEAVSNADGNTKSKDESICRIYKNITLKTKKEYLKLYMTDDNGETIKFAAFASYPNANQDTPDYEFVDQKTKQRLIKVNRIIKGDKETLKVEFFNSTGEFTKGFTAVKVLNKKSDKSPDYIAFAPTLRLAK